MSGNVSPGEHMQREPQRTDDTIAAIETEVMAKLNRRVEDQQSQFGDEQSENTAIVAELPRVITQLPRTKSNAAIFILSVVLLAALVALIVMMLRTP